MTCLPQHRAGLLAHIIRSDLQAQGQTPGRPFHTAVGSSIYLIKEFEWQFHLINVEQLGGHRMATGGPGCTSEESALWPW